MHYIKFQNLEFQNKKGTKKVVNPKALGIQCSNNMVSLSCISAITVHTTIAKLSIMVLCISQTVDLLSLKF